MNVIIQSEADATPASAPEEEKSELQLYVFMETSRAWWIEMNACEMLGEPRLHYSTRTSPVISSFNTRVWSFARQRQKRSVCEITNAWAQTHDGQKEERRRSADSNRTIINVKRDGMIDALNAWMNAHSPGEYRAWASASLLRLWAPVCSEHAAAVCLRSDSANQACGWRGNEMRWKCRCARDSSASTPARWRHALLRVLCIVFDFLCKNAGVIVYIYFIGD